MLTVHAIAGEPTSFFVEGDTLCCTNASCGKLKGMSTRQYVSFTKTQMLFLRECGVEEEVLDALRIAKRKRKLPKCPQCGAPMERRMLTVDISEENGNGRCGCEIFTMLWARRNGDPVRCKHLEAARDFALSLAIRHQLNKGKGSF